MKTVVSLCSKCKCFVHEKSEMLICFMRIYVALTMQMFYLRAVLIQYVACFVFITSAFLNANKKKLRGA